VPVRAVQRYRSAVGLAHAVARRRRPGGRCRPSTSMIHVQERLVPVLTTIPSARRRSIWSNASRKYVPLKSGPFIDFIVEHVSRLPSIKVPEVVEARRVRTLTVSASRSLTERDSLS